MGHVPFLNLVIQLAPMRLQERRSKMQIKPSPWPVCESGHCVANKINIIPCTSWMVV